MAVTSLRGAVQALRAYSEDPDPRVNASNFVALLVASSQPTFPLYLYWLVSDTVWPSLVTFLSTPFFLAVPVVSRRSSTWGRALLPLTGIANTLVCAQAFGVASGVEVFLIPCVALALLLFRPHEALFAYVISGIGLGAYILLHGRYGAPAYPYGAAEYEAFVRLNFMSAATLTAVTAMRFATILGDAEERATRNQKARETV